MFILCLLPFREIKLNILLFDIQYSANAKLVYVQITCVATVHFVPNRARKHPITDSDEPYSSQAELIPVARVGSPA